ncbi:hypothetical protein ACFCX4_18650 [Kitasatospora sp. NPDC056327]|uniref:hypothetical protein n=1 Tax=Kitasatospora sp. NPDC056327 TaxID=3345785 RepID=UPI0035DBB78A
MTDSVRATPAPSCKEAPVPPALQDTEGRKPAASHCPPLQYAPVAAFASPLTRMVLASEGLTTTLLQAAVNSDLRVRASAVHTVHAGVLDAAAHRELAASRHPSFLLRHSLLVTADGTEVSDNYVAARTDLDPRIGDAVLDTTSPVGGALARAGLALRRRILAVGHTTRPGWDRCACKVYTLDSGTGPALFVREVFNPGVLPPALRPRKPQGERS